MQIYGYLRVSTEGQDVENQKAEILLKANSLNLNVNVEWISETVSGYKVHWKERQLGKLINEKCKSGDIVIVSELSRIGRTILQILEFANTALKNSVSVYCVKQNFNITNTLESKTMLFMYSFVSELERSLISERTKNALQTKKANGIKLGRKPGLSKLDKKHEEIKKMLNEGVKQCHISKKIGCTEKTLGKYIKKHNLKAD
jgi:DNA invertase Pin-like site-specific DNA recombinase